MTNETKIVWHTVCLHLPHVPHHAKGLQNFFSWPLIREIKTCTWKILPLQKTCLAQIHAIFHLACPCPLHSDAHSIPMGMAWHDTWCRDRKMKLEKTTAGERAVCYISHPVTNNMQCILAMQNKSPPFSPQWFHTMSSASSALHTLHESCYFQVSALSCVHLTPRLTIESHLFIDRSTTTGSSGSAETIKLIAIRQFNML